MEFLNRERTHELWRGIKTSLVNKQDKLIGTESQIVGFNEDGNPIARSTASPKGIATLNEKGILEVAQRPSLAGIKGGSGTNLLGNSDFSIWQRYSSGIYTGVPINTCIVDGFKILSSNGNILNTIKRIDGGGIYNEAGPNCRVKYFMEGASKLNGNTITLSTLEKNPQGVILLNTATFMAQKFNDNTDLFNATSALAVWVRSGSSILRVKLELGAEQTLAHKEGDEWVLNDPPPDKALELAKCQRYQVVFSASDTNQPLLAPGYTINTTTARFLLDLPGPLRATPTISVSNLYVNLSGVRFPVTAAAVLGPPAQNKINIQVTCSSANFAANQPCFLEGQGDYRLLLDANL